MPERTVDAWVAAAICERFPTAHLWAPTPIGDDDWDAAADLGEGKLFLLEDKGTTFLLRSRKQPHEVHRITLNRAQLDRYCDEIDQPGQPLFYVLPSPPWSGVPTGPVPAEAVGRFDSAAGPFIDWAWVIRATL